jgi:DNA repair protein RecN (Recombination protein N)
VLTHLQLRDFVIVDAAELSFGPGLTALTGETGAGKSIVVDALLMLAGGRAGGDVVREGAERAEATAGFASLPAPALAWLRDQAIDHDGEVLVRRIVGADGRSRSYLNGQLVALQSLREFAESLIEIHGQQEFQHLVRREAQRALLDEHGSPPQLLAAVADLYARQRACRARVEALRAAAENREARLDVLRYQLGELEADVGAAADIESLLIERKRIAGRGRLADCARTALTAIYEADEGSAHDMIGKAQAALRLPGEADPAMGRAGAALGEAALQLREAAGILRDLLDALDVDPAHQDEVEQRAATLEALARKHKVGLLELPEQRRRLEAELHALETAAVDAAARGTELAQLAAQYREAAGHLTAARRAGARELSARITGLMQTLGMRGGRFAVELATDADSFGPHGSDSVEFLVSANPGQAPKSLAKVASGGELSRISLAVQVAAAAARPPPCMVFDEVDAGIGGAIAEIVGRQLRALGARGQVLCVTHLPQVAAQAHHQFRVRKSTDGRSTRTSIATLEAEDRVDEIARMLGGIAVTAQARAHAREMLAAADGADAGEPAGPVDAPEARGKPPGKSKRSRPATT